MINTTARMTGLLFLLLLGQAWAETLHGHVIAVSDGATITVISAKHQLLRVRIAGIDAPERGQPYAKQSHENLGNLVRRKEVTVEWQEKDRYGRLLGTVSVKGHDVGLEQVRAGLAWWYREYAKGQTPGDRRLYEAAEEVARKRKLGLWADPAPMPPWEWRNAQHQPK